MSDAISAGNLKPYPEYKDSKLPWLGNIPDHWEVKRGKTLFQCIDIRSSTGKEELLTVAAKDGVVPRRFANVTMFKAESYVGYKLCWPGDLVINSLWAWGRGLGVSKYHGIVSSAYGVYRLKPGFEGYSSYIHELVRSLPFHWELQVRSKGIWISRLQLTDEAFLDAPFPLPPISEISCIELFLEDIDNRIRSYINTKKNLINLLNEQKQAIINQTVTQGIDPNIPLKPSGVEWLKDIPKHWKVVRLKNIVSRITSGPRGWSDFMADQGSLFIRIGNLTRDSLNLELSDATKVKLPMSVLSEAKRTRVETNDILISITAFIGSVAIVPEGIEEAYVNQHIACCKPCSDEINVRWVGYVLLSHVGQVHGQICMYGGTKQGLSLNDVKNYILLLPPKAEQDSLVNSIESRISNLDQTITTTKREIDLLIEYRTRIISDVITGKVDVRNLNILAKSFLKDEDQEMIIRSEENGEEMRAVND
jgi:type I restriction enzyme S subunit